MSHHLFRRELTRAQTDLAADMERWGSPGTSGLDKPWRAPGPRWTLLCIYPRIGYVKLNELGVASRPGLDIDLYLESRWGRSAQLKIDFAIHLISN